MNTAILLIVIINIITISILLGTTRYLNYIDAKAQRDYQRIRQNIEILESFETTRKHYSNYGQE